MTAITTPDPGPLDLNCNEGKWLAALKGPIPGGWFSFGLHGNPPFGVPVELAKGGGRGKPDLEQGILLGYRTQELVPHPDPDRPEARSSLTEKWIIAGVIRQSEGGWMVRKYAAGEVLAYWRPRTDPGAKYQAGPPAPNVVLTALLFLASVAMIADVLGRWFGWHP